MTRNTHLGGLGHDDLPVNTTRTVAPVLAAVATVLWAVILVAYFSTGPDEGVNIGAGALALLAVPLSIVASVTLLVSQLSESRRPGGRSLMADRVVSVLAVASIICLGAPMLIGPMIETDAAAAAARMLLLVGIVSFTASSALLVLRRAVRG